MVKKQSVILEQIVPLTLTVISFVGFSLILYLLILALNRSGNESILTQIRIADVIIGMTIYLKTSVDFAIFMGALMARFPGWKSRIAIEIGTGAGNALGTMIVLSIWNYFRAVEWLLALMIFIAALVLVKLAEEGMDHVKGNELGILTSLAHSFKKSLHTFNRFTQPILKYIIPQLSSDTKKTKGWLGLFVTAFSIPFILGLDDFAGYVPVFNIVNVFGFSIGVFLGHMILNILLFISPNRTVKVVKNPLISFLGSIAFVILAGWGIWEVIKILLIGH